MILSIIQMYFLTSSLLKFLKRFLENVTHNASVSFSGLWALINNAGIQLVGPVELMPVVTYKQLADVNLYGTISTTKAALPLIRKAQGTLGPKHAKRKRRYLLYSHVKISLFLVNYF